MTYDPYNTGGQQYPYNQQYGYGGQPPFQPPPPKKSRTGLIVGIVVGALVLCVLIGGIGTFAIIALGNNNRPTPVPSSSSSAPTPSSSFDDGGMPTPSATPSSDPAVDQQFVATLKSAGIKSKSGDDATLIAAGHLVCQEFDAGKTFKQVVADFSGSTLTDYQKGFLIGAATTAYCPNHRDKLSSA